MPIDPGHDTGRMSARITREEGEAAAAFDQRGEVGFAIFSPEDQEIAFPMSEAAAIRNFLRTCADRIGHRNMETAWLTSVALPSRTAGNGKMAPQLLVASIRSIDILVNGLVAHRLPVAPMTPQVTRNLFCDQAADKRSAI